MGAMSVYDIILEYWAAVFRQENGIPEPHPESTEETQTDLPL
jgi:hypothetical protein